MAKNTQEIPYTEIVERVQKLGRLSPNTLEKIRGVVQDIYFREIASKYDWKFLRVSSSIVTTPEYNTGTFTANTGDTVGVFSSDVTLTSIFTGRQLKVQGNDPVYNVTFSNTTAATLSPSFEGSGNASGNGYTIFQPFYALAADFDRFPTDEGLIVWNGGEKKSIPDISHDTIKWRDEYSATPGIPSRMRIVTPDTAGNQRIELNPPPKYGRAYNYEYYRRLRPLVESSGQLLSISANQTTVSGLPGNSRFTEATTGDWLRVDALGTGQDSSWYRIIAIANDSSLTISTNFANTAITSSANYMIARAPEMPPILHAAVMYGALRGLMVDQNDPQFQDYQIRYAEAMSDAKANFVTRQYNQEMHSMAEEYMYRR